MNGMLIKIHKHTCRDLTDDVRMPQITRLPRMDAQINVNALTKERVKALFFSVWLKQ